MGTKLASWVAILGVLAISPVRAQQEEKKTHEPGEQQALLKMFAGDWDFTVKCSAPGKEATSGQGTETAKMDLGGWWLICDSKGSMTGAQTGEYTGKGIIGYNPKLKHYVGVWVDSGSPFMGMFIGDADATGKTWTFMMKHERPSGEKYGAEKPGAEKHDEMHHGPFKMVHEFQDKDHRTCKIYGKDKDGNEQLWTEITFTRKSEGVH